MRTLVYTLILALATLGGLPRAALCVGNHHEPHVIFGHTHDHHADGDHIPHDDADESIVCGHAIDHDDCGDGDCTDVPLGTDGIALSGDGALTALPATEVAVLPVPDLDGGRLVAGTRSSATFGALYLEGCALLL